MHYLLYKSNRYVKIIKEESRSLLIIEKRKKELDWRCVKKGMLVKRLFGRDGRWRA